MFTLIAQETFAALLAVEATPIIIGVAVLLAVIAIAGLLIAPGRGGSLDRPKGSGAADTAVLDRRGDEATVEMADPSLVEAPAETPADAAEDGSDAVVVEVEIPEEPIRVRDRLARARAALSGYVGSILSRSSIDSSSWDELEEALIRADVGIGPTTALLDGVRARVKAEGYTETADLIEATKAEMKQTLAGPTDLARSTDGPTIWLIVGVNGVGKTTTIGKLGRQQVDLGHKVVMAAGDTFRAAAAEQLGTWADRCGATLVRGAEGADPSSVIFDAVASASANGADVVLADTAGRLHTKTNLMDELGKVRRVADKGDGTVTEVLLVLDATTGQNGLVQARQFTEAAEVTGVVLTKLDGSAKGGIVFAIRAELGIPIKLVGLGEGAHDLVEFDSDAFVDALFDQA